jgi:hypothetical protein
LLDFLFPHVCHPDFTYRHRWALGDVAMSDNRSTLHYAVHEGSSRNAVKWDCWKKERVHPRVNDQNAKRPVGAGC